MFEKQYSDKDIEIMKRMWQEGYTAAEIGDVIGKSKWSIRQYMNRNRDKHGFEKKAPGRPFCRAKFEKQWYGSVPLGHWTITKPWGNQWKV